MKQLPIIADPVSRNKEKMSYILTFYLDPEMVNDPKTKNIDDITMSYTFFMYVFSTWTLDERYEHL